MIRVSAHPGRWAILISVLAVGCSGADVTGLAGDDSSVAIEQPGGGDTVEADATEADSLNQPVTKDSQSDDGPDALVDGDDGDAAEDVAAPEAELGCNHDECDIGGACYANQEGHPDSPCLTCLVVVTRDDWSPLDGGSCDDGDLCTEEGTCWDGECVGTPTACDDGNACTAGLCESETGACTFSPTEGSCDDGDACTDGDVCDAGACVAGVSLLCDDGNPCTENACDATVGCVAVESDDTPCDDGSVCTVGDSCSAGTCVPGAPLACDDTNICTVDTCDVAAGCQHQSLDALCADENPCTDDVCDASAGCIYPPNAVDCDDQSACTSSDVCSGGSCLGTPVIVDDGNPCTDDSCDPAVGIINAPNALPCSDDNACTLGDQCSAMACVPGTASPNCDDDNGCTDDSCDPADGCRNYVHTKPCDDGLECTVDDVCNDGSCVGIQQECDDDNACTTDACVEGEGCQNTVIVSNTCRPQIVVSYPPRAATLEATTSYLDITGTVSSGAGDIVALTVNGQEAELDGTAFSASMTPEVGGNTIVIEASDALGTVRKHVQAFHWAESYTPPDGFAAPGIGIWMAQETIDDGDHSMPPDDLATIFELVLDGYPLDGLISGNVASTSIVGVSYDVKISNFKAGPRSISLDAKAGKLQMTATILDIEADVKLKTDSWFAPDFPGSVEIPQTTVTGDVVLSVNDHALEATLQDVSVDISGLDFDFDSGTVDFLLGWLADILIDDLVGELESSFEGEFANQIEPLLADALSTLAFATSFEMPSLDPSGAPVTVDLATDFKSTSINNAGMTLKLRANASAADANSYDNLGAVMRAGCGVAGQTMPMLKDGPFEIGFADDTFNLLLYAAWQGGLLEFTVPPEMLADVDLSQYGISPDAVSIQLSGMLAPVVSDCSEDGLTLHVGDLKVTANLDLFGQTLDVEMFASFSAGVALSADGGVLGIEIEEIVGLDSQIAILQEDLVASEAGIAALIDDNLVPALLGALGGGALGGFPLPEIALTDDMLNLPAGTLPPGTAIGINPLSSSHTDGNVFISGTLK